MNPAAYLSWPGAAHGAPAVAAAGWPAPVPDVLPSEAAQAASLPCAAVPPAAQVATPQVLIQAVEPAPVDSAVAVFVVPAGTAAQVSVQPAVVALVDTAVAAVIAGTEMAAAVAAVFDIPVVPGRSGQQVAARSLRAHQDGPRQAEPAELLEPAPALEQSASMLPSDELPQHCKSAQRVAV